MVEMEVDDGCMGHHYDGSGDQVDAWMLDVIDGTGGMPLLFFRSNGSPGNMSHSRITSYPPYKHTTTPPRLLRNAHRAFQHGKRCSVPQAWLGGFSFYLSH